MTDKTLDTKELDTLRSVIGATIASYEGCPLGPGDYYGAVRINAGDVSLDISNHFEPVDVSFEEGAGTEDVGTMRVKASSDALDLGDLVSGPQLSSTEVGSVVCGVEVVNDTVEMLLGDAVTNSFAFTQAVVFQLEKGFLVVDRGIWFEVFLGAGVTADPRRFIRDTEKDWNRGSGGYRALVRREYVKL